MLGHTGWLGLWWNHAALSREESIKSGAPLSSEENFGGGIKRYRRV